MFESGEAHSFFVNLRAATKFIFTFVIRIEILFPKKQPGSPTGADRLSPERKAWVQKESSMLLSKNIMIRDKVYSNLKLFALIILIVFFGEGSRRT